MVLYFLFFEYVLICGLSKVIIIWIGEYLLCLRGENGLLSFPLVYFENVLLKSLLWKNKSWLRSCNVWNKVWFFGLRHDKVLSQKGRLCSRCHGWKWKREEEYWGLIGGKHGVSWPSSLKLILLLYNLILLFSLWGIQVLFYAMLKLGIMPKYGEVM